MTTVRYSSSFDVPAEGLFAFHEDVRNLARISPPFPRLRRLRTPGPATEGGLQRFRLSAGPLSTTWTARIARVVPGRLIEDRQESGPFRRWRHQHRVTAEGSGSCLADVVSFRLLPTPAGAFAEWLAVRPVLWLLFAWRHWRTRALLKRDTA